MSLPSATVLGFLLLSVPALAGDIYTFSIQHDDDSDITQGKVFLDGRKYRLERKPDPKSTNPYRTMISKDGGAHELALNSEDHTFYEPKASARTSFLLRLLPIGNASVTNVTLDTVEALEPETVSGVAAKRHEIKLSYDISVEIPPPDSLSRLGKGQSEIIHGKVKVDAVYWLAAGTTPALPALLRPAIHTGFPEIDPKLEGAIAALQGVPVKQQVTFSTEGDRGTTPLTSTRIVLLQSHKTQATKASAFEVPTGFKMHEPEFSRPGLGPVPPG
ncbi:MAG TPA: hypothetical protein VLB76_21905 [Thermoanaerobaculia bacterium]|nr:hypothetical protein [Thermoanaerobaculia bacterium]